MTSIEDRSFVHRPGGRVVVTPLVFWHCFDIALAALVILVSTNTFNRFGIGSPIWAVCYAMAAIRLLSSPGFLAWIFRNNLSQLFYPAVCIASAVWSKTPAWSFVAGFQLLASIVIALTIGARVRPITLILLLFLVLLFPLALSLVNWRTGAFGQIYANSGGMIGIYTQKNMLGENALFVLLSGLALILCGALRSFVPLLVIFSGMAMAALSLALAQSVTPTIVWPVSSGLLLLLCFRQVDSRLVAFCAVVAFIALALGPFCLAVLGIDPIEELLAAFGKNSTLTGRTKIWDFGFQVLRDHWLVGVGFLSFWRAAEFSSYATIIQAIGGENVRAFHNFLLEIWIGTGLPGLITMLVLLGAGLSRTWRAYRATGSVSAAFSLVIIVTAIILGLPGAGLYRQHESLMMFVVMFGASTMVSVTRPDAPRRGEDKSRHPK